MFKLIRFVVTIPWISFSQNNDVIWTGRRFSSFSRVIRVTKRQSQTQAFIYYKSSWHHLSGSEFRWTCDVSDYVGESSSSCNIPEQTCEAGISWTWIKLSFVCRSFWRFFVQFLDRMVALGQSRSNMVARQVAKLGLELVSLKSHQQAGRAFCEMLKEVEISFPDLICWGADRAQMCRRVSGRICSRR